MKKHITQTQCILTVIMVTFVIISNIMNAKQIQLPFIVCNAGMFTFPIIYILSDVFSEIYGYYWSRFTCYLSFAMNLIVVICFSIAISCPSPEYFTASEAFKTVLGSVPRTSVASFIAFLLGDFVNDKVFARMKEKHLNDMTGFGWRAILSSFVGELVDSCIFLPLAFIGQMPVETLCSMIIMQVFTKTLYEVIILPVTSLCVRYINKFENNV